MCLFQSNEGCQNTIDLIIIIFFWFGSSIFLFFFSFIFISWRLDAWDQRSLTELFRVPLRPLSPDLVLMRFCTWIPSLWTQSTVFVKEILLTKILPWSLMCCVIYQFLVDLFWNFGIGFWQLPLKFHIYFILVPHSKLLISHSVI